MMRRYKVNETFYSLQGEGYFTGTPAVFLRLSGCNRRCDFCDTDHSGYAEMTAAEIVAKVSRYPARHIVVTGGEPLLQLDEELCEALHAAGFFIQVETNGTLPAPAGVDWVTCSPKDEPWGIDRVDEVKIVYTGQGAAVDDVAERVMAQTGRAGVPVHLFLQPCSGLNVEETIAYVKEHPYWRLSLQTHKLVGIE